jgi:ABC-type glycerol-3-phosphate transport system substrate-binding protein
MVNSHSDNQEKAKEAIAAWTSPETLSEGMAEDSPGKAMTPVHEDVETTLENDDWKGFVDAFSTGRALQKVTWGPVRQEFYPRMQEVAWGEKDPFQAGEELHSNLQDIESEI